MTDDKLLSCPFCGGEAILEDVSNFLGAPYWKPACHNEQCALNERRPSQAEAITAWNTRQQSILSESVNGEAVVPREPTEEMYNAGYDATRLENGTPQFADAGFCLAHAGKIYRAMVDAALPKQPVNLDGEAVERVARCTTCGAAMPHGYLACDTTMGQYCEACWDAVDCESQHGEGCASACWIGPNDG